MIDDLLGELFGEAVFGGLDKSRRAQLLFRVFFGLLGAGLGTVGAIHFWRSSGDMSNTTMRLAMLGVFVFMACFSLFNLALGRTWRWPGVLFVVSFVMMIAARLLFGR